MPTYAYACKSCGHRFDTVQSFSEASLTECPECGGELRKQYGSIGVTFNGSGFYRNDSRAGSDGAKPAAKSESKGDSSSTPSSSPAPKSDGGSKPAAAPSSSSSGASSS